jgi:aminoglycoside phosphotransferase
VTIGCSGAEVFRVVAAGEADRFLKVTRRGEWHSAGDEFRRLEWLRGRLSVPEVLLFEKDAQREFLLTSALAGVMAQDSALARDPKALLAALAEGMRAIHALPAEGCPFDGRLDVMLALAEDRVRRGAVNVADFEPENLGRTAEGHPRGASGAPARRGRFGLLPRRFLLPQHHDRRLADDRLPGLGAWAACPTAGAIWASRRRA